MCEDLWENPSQFQRRKNGAACEKKEALGFLQIDEKTHSIRIGQEIKGNS